MLIGHLFKNVVKKFRMLIGHLYETIILDVNWLPLQDHSYRFMDVNWLPLRNHYYEFLHVNWLPLQEISLYVKWLPLQVECQIIVIFVCACDNTIFVKLYLCGCYTAVYDVYDSSLAYGRGRDVKLLLCSFSPY